MNAHSTTTHRVRGLLLILGSSVATALTIVSILIYFYGPLGVYYVDNIILSPNILVQASYNETNKTTGVRQHYTYDHIEFYHRLKGRSWDHQEVSIEDYATFFALTKGVASDMNQQEELASLFSTPSYSSLILYMRPTQTTPYNQNELVSFQEIQFNNEHKDLFRIKLRDQMGPSWAYFRVPGIINKTHTLFLN